MVPWTAVIARRRNEGADRVWFLAGAFLLAPTVTAHRRCTVPDDKALFLPVFNAFGDNVGFGGPPCPCLPNDPLLTAEQLAAGVASQVDGAILHASIDRVPVRNLPAYRAPRAGFGFEVPRVDNLYGMLGGEVPGISWPNTHIYPVAEDGYYLMVNPLPAGTHTIKFGGTKNGFQVDITYDITVVHSDRE